MDEEPDGPEAITAVFLQDVLSAAWRLATLPTESIKCCIPFLDKGLEGAVATFDCDGAHRDPEEVQKQ